MQTALALELAQRTRRRGQWEAAKAHQRFFFRLPLTLHTHDGEKGLREQREGDVYVNVHNILEAKEQCFFEEAASPCGTASVALMFITS